jgi:hypothetical protein
MLEPRGDQDLAQEASFACDPASQHLLDRDIATQLAVARPRDSPQATASVLAEVLVPPALSERERQERTVVGR